ncbi:MAG: SDR family oxidoreductase, partial [Myxococcota bacterium]
LAPRRINVVSPGIIITPMMGPESEARDAFYESATKSLAIPRPGQSEEVARAILFVIENEYVTGTTVDVDGGALLR